MPPLSHSALSFAPPQDAEAAEAASAAPTPRKRLRPAFVEDPASDTESKIFGSDFGALGAGGGEKKGFVVLGSKFTFVVVFAGGCFFG